MLGRTHLVFGIFISLISILLIHISNHWLFILIVIIGSLFPDIDKSSSFIGRYFSSVSTMFKHRGLFHSFYALILFSFAVHYLFGFIYSLGFLIGFLSHLFMDSLTKRGISFFIFDKKIRGKLVSGGLFDSFFFLLFSSIDLFLFLMILFQF